MARILCLLIFFILPLFQAFSQYYSTGQDPASVRWRQIRTERYRLIYPSDFEQKAQYLANIFNHVVKASNTIPGVRVPNIPVVVHSRSVISNGLTTWAPRRIELYPCLPQQSYTQEWLEQLAIHEYRHAVQISSVNRGFSKFLGYLFGEQITGGILGLYIPSWFLEGDATMMETALGNAGRGRSAMFERTLRAQLLDKGIYSYDLATLGSYKTFVPNAYDLGYYLVAQGRARYGRDVWNEALSRIARFPFMVVPFNSGIRKSTGLWKTQLYRQLLGDLDSAWSRQALTTEITAFRPITRPEPGNYKVYSHPQWLDDSTLIALRYSMDDVGRFVSIDRNTGHETIIHTPGPVSDGSVSLIGNILAWCEREADPRWQNQNFSVVWLYHINKGKTERLTSATRYFSPVLNANATQLAVVNVTTANKVSIDILDVSTRKLLSSFPFPAGSTIMNPSWPPSVDQIFFTLLNESGSSVACLDLKSGSVRTMIPPTSLEIYGQPRLLNNHILYCTEFSGIANLYAFDTVTRVTKQVTSSKFSASDAVISPDGSLLAWLDYNADGAMVVEKRVESGEWKVVSGSEDHVWIPGDQMSEQVGYNIQDSVRIQKIDLLNQADSMFPQSVPPSITQYTSKRYSKAGHLFNLHSWGPLVIDAGNLEVNPGVMVLSQNLLSSMFASAGFEYDMNEATGKFYTTLSYAGLYPQFDFRFDIGNRSAYTTSSVSSQLVKYTWQETNLKFKVTIPWNFSRGRNIRSLQPTVGTTLIGVQHDVSTPENFTQGWMNTLDYGLYAANYQRSGQKDLYPRFGQVFNAAFRHSLVTKNNLGAQFGTSLSLYFPGLLKHHGVLIYAGYQQEWEKDDLSYSYGNMIRTPRGWSNVSAPQLLSLQGNYRFPIFYPDLSLGSLIYWKRLKAGVFYDFTLGWEHYGKEYYETIGADISVDIHLLRFLAPFELGFRFEYFPGVSDWGWELLYSVSIP